MSFYLRLALLLLMAKAIAQPNFISHFCINNAGNFTANSTFKTNRDHVLSSITTNQKLNNSFYRFSYGQSTDIANAIGVCRPDIRLELCRSCLNDSVQLLPKLCPNQKEATGWYENCSLLYSSRSLSNQMDISPTFRIQSTKSATNSYQFIQRIRNLFSSLKTKASLGGSLHKYVSWKSTGIFTPSCMVNCKPAQFFGTVIDDKSTRPLMTVSTASPTDNKTRAEGTKKNVKTRVHIVIIMVLSVLSCWMLIICIYMFLKSKRIEQRVESH